MATLTNEELGFLKSQHISPSLVLDAAGLSKKERLAAMERLEKYFYFGGPPCRNSGHHLRTKAGHCIQCDTSKIAYQLRYSGAGHVYLAHSRSTGYVKVGYTKFHPQERAELLRTFSYGGISDWSIDRFVYFEINAGRTEFAIHAEMESALTRITYDKGEGITVASREIFACDLTYARGIFDEITTKARGNVSPSAGARSVASNIC
ncbi:GIY-YIG nuclease family protein [Methylolobus aquaticus]